MYPNFENLPEDRKKKILDACMDEFGENGYKKASTNEIVKKAGISKGILFHYFGNKKNLYLYILDYAISLFVDVFYKNLKNLPSDMFERFKEWGIIKIKISYENPEIYKLIMSAYLENPIEIKDDLNERYTKLYEEHMPKFFQGIDMSKFRKGLDAQKALQVVMLFFDSLSNKYLNEFKAMGAERSLSEIENVMNEMDEYMEMLKYGIYNREK